MLSVIIPTKDRTEILNATIAAVVTAIEEIDAEIIVINDSKEGKVEFPDHKNIKVIDSRRSSAAISRNLGAKNSKGDILLFLDDDILIDKICLKELYTKTLSNDNTIYLPNWEYPKTMNGQLSKTSFGRFVIRSSYNNLKGYLGNPSNWTDDKAIMHNGVASYCLMMKKDLFEKVNGYSEKFSNAGYEDHDISIKIVKQNIKILIEPKLIVFHNESDKLQIKNWLIRMEKAAVTRKQAVNMGYSDLKLTYGSFTNLFLPLVYASRKPLTFFSSLVPNKPFLDPLYSAIFKLLISSYIYKGYTSANDN